MIARKLEIKAEKENIKFFKKLGDYIPTDYLNKEEVYHYFILFFYMKLTILFNKNNKEKSSSCCFYN